MVRKPFLALIGLLALVGCGSSPGTASTGSIGLTPTTQAPTAFPSSSTGSSSTTVPDTTRPGAATSSSTTPTTTPSLPTITVTGGEVSGPDTLDFKLGAEAAFEVVADVADEVHVHGYDLHFDTEPGVPVVVRFTADVPGEFEVELEGASLQLVKLVVEP